MPRGDGTGPIGMGPMTGRGVGYCAGYGFPGNANPMYMAGGFGRGRGFRRMYYATGIPGSRRFGYPVYQAGFNPGVDERDFLKQQVESLENELQQMKKRLSEIEKDEE